MSKLLFISSLTVLLILTGCSPNRCLNDIRKDENITVGKVQRAIRLGMTNSEVVECLGSPNIVSTDEQRREVWIYDKVATETVYSENAVGGGIGALILGHSGGGIGGFSASKRFGAHSTTQRTLTIIIKFNNKGCVRDIAYHTSKF